MIADCAREDYQEMIERGFSPTLDDFDRLNSLALRVTDGPETTAANVGRIGWAGDVPFFAPTYAAFAWYTRYAVRLATAAQKDCAWFFALAHARDRGAFDGLRSPGEIVAAVDEWLSALPVADAEIRRACRYAAAGYDVAEPGMTEEKRAEYAKKTAEEKLAENLGKWEDRVTETAAATGIPPRELETETPSRLAKLCEDADRLRGNGGTVRDVSALRRDYDMARREIYARLRAEKAAEEAAANGE